MVIINREENRKQKIKNKNKKIKKQRRRRERENNFSKFSFTMLIKSQIFCNSQWNILLFHVILQLIKKKKSTLIYILPLKKNKIIWLEKEKEKLKYLMP